MMITGFLDDSAKSPWGELIKGILDLVLALFASITFLIFNTSDVSIIGHVFHIPVVIYAILAVALIWGSINVTNCSDGVDGLCGTVSVIEIFAIVVIFKEELGKFTSLGIILAFVLVAYLAYNWNPSSVLMGDAGSRTIGFTLALLCMKTHHPYAFLILSLVFILDGGLGLMKLAIMRVTKKPFLVNIRFPLHDELRKNRGMKIPLIVLIMAVSESVMCAITSLIIYLSNK
jgi:phospho-N-acetylmuramoyl-pentapeptide-transferase